MAYRLMHTWGCWVSLARAIGRGEGRVGRPGQPQPPSPMSEAINESSPRNWACCKNKGRTKLIQLYIKNNLIFLGFRSKVKMNSINIGLSVHL